MKKKEVEKYLRNLVFDKSAKSPLSRDGMYHHIKSKVTFPVQFPFNISSSNKDNNNDLHRIKIIVLDRNLCQELCKRFE